MAATETRKATGIDLEDDDESTSEFDSMVSLSKALQKSESSVQLQTTDEIYLQLQKVLAIGKKSILVIW